MKRLKVYNAAAMAGRMSVRQGEVKIGQSLQYLPAVGSLNERVLTAAVEGGARFALLGIPEDIGPRANFGKGGAVGGWDAFLDSFLNLQSNRHIRAEEILLLGHVECNDLVEESYKSDITIEKLRELTSDLDDRVNPIMHQIFNSGLTPIVIGGGHNNCYPILKALSSHYHGSSVNAINLDPHADFRSMEGRHSGNGFRYAHFEGALRDYHVMCLNELKNNQESLEALDAAGFTYDSFQSVLLRSGNRFDDALSAALDRIETGSPAYGIEVDTDSITQMPVSAYNECGLSPDTGARFVQHCAARTKAKYLHLCEAAPLQHPISTQVGKTAAGQVLALLASIFIQTRQGISLGV